MQKPQTLAAFQEQYLNLIPAPVQAEMSRFNVFRLADVAEAETKCSSYGRRQFFKISLLSGSSTYHYADRSIRVERNALVFSNPLVPYHWDFHGEKQAAVFCVFTDAFLPRFASMPLAESPVFRPGGQPVFALTDSQYQAMAAIFEHMIAELQADYAFKYDVLRNAVRDLLHGAHRLQPVAAGPVPVTAASRLATLFLELLERQYPIEAPEQRVRLRFPLEFARQLTVHVNHLNKVLKDITGQTTSALIAARLTQEAKVLLMHTQWSVSEIAWCLGFEELSHFTNFFKKNAQVTPISFRRDSRPFSGII